MYICRFEVEGIQLLKKEESKWATAYSLITGFRQQFVIIHINSKAGDKG